MTDLASFLSQHPEAFPDKPKQVRMIETHISWVFLTGTHAYKIKKPVDFGFLDFSTLEKRRKYCERELVLNERLSSGLYLAVLPISKKGDRYRIGGDGNAAEYCVQMREIAQDRIMTALVKKGAVGRDVIDELVGVLRRFYNNSERSKEIDKFGSVATIQFNVNENFEQTEQFIGRTLSQEMFDFIKDTSFSFIRRHAKVFNLRVKQKKIRDCHGDLHTGNIFIADKIYVFDCIEFNERFRYGDVLADIAYLLMDLEFMGKKDLAEYITNKMVARDEQGLLTFYKCYRAYVKLKVLGFRLNEQDLRNRDEVLRTAKRYGYLAFRYAAELQRITPRVIIMSGLSGTGKSRWARTLAGVYGAEILKTDAIRKEIFSGAGPDQYGSGAYTEESKLRVYEEMFQRAGSALRAGKPIILDATFQKKELRDRVAALFKNNVIIRAVCSDEDVVKRRLHKRESRGFKVSHAGWDIYLRQKQTFEDHADHHILIDTAKDEDDNFVHLIVQLHRLGVLRDD